MEMIAVSCVSFNLLYTSRKSTGDGCEVVGNGWLLQACHRMFRVQFPVFIHFFPKMNFKRHNLDTVLLCQFRR